MKRLCTICARGGSKGVPGKNIRPLFGKPLLAWTIEQARQSALFDKIAVSSDDPAILQVARQAGVDLAIPRPAELATDASSKLPAIAHAVRAAETAFDTTYDTLCDLDATSPLRHVQDIIGAVAMLESGERTNIITAAPARRSPYFNLIEVDANGNAQLSKPLAQGVVRRQDAPASFDMNASIYVWRRDRFLSDPRVFYADTGLFEMPEERSHDIDNEFDFRIVELLMEERAGVPRRFRQAYDLRGKVAVVTGGAGIIGRSVCEAFAEHGASVAIVEADPARGEELAAHLRDRFQIAAAAFTVDVSDPEAVAKIVPDIEAALGPIDILHNNAATKGKDSAKFFASVEEFDPAAWREIMSVNVDGYFYMAREVGRRMAERGKGSIIQTCSIYGVVGPDQRIYEGSEYLGRAINTPAVYSASKAAVVGLTNHLATLWGAQGVRVNTLTPGGVSSGQNAAFEARYGARTPLARMARADEIAHGALYLASDASSYVTGHNLMVDGGWTAW